MITGIAGRIVDELESDSAVMEAIDEYDPGLVKAILRAVRNGFVGEQYKTVEELDRVLDWVNDRGEE